MKYYSLCDAWKDRKEGDRVVLMKMDCGKKIEDYYFNILRVTNGIPCTFEQPSQSMTIHQVTSDKWQIIPVRKRPISFEEWQKKPRKLANDAATPDDYAYFIWNDSAKNRDLLYVDLMECINKYQNDDSIEYHKSGINEAFDKINTAINMEDI
jgi:hypothetical protein